MVRKQSIKKFMHYNFIVDHKSLLDILSSTLEWSQIYRDVIIFPEIQNNPCWKILNKLKFKDNTVSHRSITPNQRGIKSLLKTKLLIINTNAFRGGYRFLERRVRGVVRRRRSPWRGVRAGILPQEIFQNDRGSRNWDFPHSKPNNAACYNVSFRGFNQNPPKLPHPRQRSASVFFLSSRWLILFIWISLFMQLETIM